MAHSINELTGRFAGEEVWVLGNGPSVNDVPFDRLDRRRVVGTNRILRKYDPGLNVLVDYEVWNQERGAMVASDCGLAVSHALWDTCIATGKPLPDERVYLFTHDANSYPGAPEGPLYYGFLSGYYAAEIAVRMVWPAGRVILAGFELGWPEKGPTHFFGDGREVGCHTKRFAEGIAALKVLHHATKKVDMRVFGESVLRKAGFEGAE